MHALRETLGILLIVVLAVFLWSSGSLERWTLELVEAQIEMYGIEATGVSFE